MQETENVETKVHETSQKNKSKKKMRSKRNNIEILYAICKVCENGAIKTHILDQVSINLNKWKELSFLLDDSYIRKEKGAKGSLDLYFLDKRGRGFIEAVDELIKITKHNPKIFSDERIKLKPIRKRLPRIPYVEPDVSDAFKSYAGVKLSSVKIYGEEELIHFISLFIKEHGNLSLHSTNPYELLRGFENEGILKKIPPKGTNCYKLVQNN